MCCMEEVSSMLYKEGELCAVWRRLAVCLTKEASCVLYGGGKQYALQRRLVVCYGGG